MENQHRKIAGYRELSQEEIDLMNRIKAAGAALIELQVELAQKLRDAEHQKFTAAKTDDQAAIDEYQRFAAAEPQRWAAIGKTDIQTGIMALVRAVAQPAGGV
jgi:hypothetical protein